MKISVPPPLYWLLHLWVLGISGILLIALIMQFAYGELPCPLCMLQRYCMFLSTVGPMWIIVQARRRQLTSHLYQQGMGLAQLGALLGAVISARQVFLHILPGDPGYGAPFLGVHLYTWAFLAFCGVLTVCSIILLFAATIQDTDREETLAGSTITTCVIALFVAVLAVNSVMIVFLQGFAWILPDDPQSYHLLPQLQSM